MEFGRDIAVRVEVPRGGRLKFRPDGRLHYASPWRCPFNYGSVPDAPRAPDGDLQDALVLGPRAPVGAMVVGRLAGVVRVLDEGVRDDKWVVLAPGHEPDALERERVEHFFWRFQLGKSLLAFLRGTEPTQVLGVDWGPGPPR